MSFPNLDTDSAPPPSYHKKKGEKTKQIHTRTQRD